MQTMREIKAALMDGHGRYDGPDWHTVRVRHVAGHKSGAAIGEWWGDWPRATAEHVAEVLAAEFGGTIHTDPHLSVVLSGRGPGGRPPVGPLVTLRYPPELLDRLDAHARQTDTTRSALVRDGALRLLAGEPAPDGADGGKLEMISIRLPADLIAQLDTAAKAAGTTRSGLLRQAGELALRTQPDR